MALYSYNSLFRIETIHNIFVIKIEKAKYFGKIKSIY